MSGVIALDINELIEQLCSDQAVARLKALQVLVQYGSDIVPALLQRLDEGSSNRQKATIISVLEEIRDPRAVNVLIETLSHSSLTLRMAAAKALGNFPEPGVYRALVERLNQETGIVQGWVVLSLGKLGDPRAIEPLLRLLHETSSASAKYVIIRVLGELGDAELIPYIRAYVGDPDDHVRRSALIALQQLDGGNE